MKKLIYPILCIVASTAIIGLSVDCNGNTEKQGNDSDSIVAEEDITSGPSIKMFTVNGTAFGMIVVKAGTFMMGGTPEMTEAYLNEKPAHEVTLTKDYYIGQTEVTQELWMAVMGNNPSYNIGDNLPVESVSWNDCLEFIDALNMLTGENFRLPTEAEWEYAARGGNKSKGYQYPGSNNVDEVAWYFDNSDQTSHPVMEKKANELGLYDMGGNVEEWCNDLYEEFNCDEPLTDPMGAEDSDIHVVRGNNYFVVAGDCHTSYRNGVAPEFGSGGRGLRLALNKE